MPLLLEPPPSSGQDSMDPNSNHVVKTHPGIPYQQPNQSKSIRDLLFHNRRKSMSIVPPTQQISIPSRTSPNSSRDKLSFGSPVNQVNPVNPVNLGANRPRSQSVFNTVSALRPVPSGNYGRLEGGSAAGSLALYGEGVGGMVVGLKSNAEMAREVAVPWSKVGCNFGCS